MTVLEIIQAVIGNSRGLGWCVEYDGQYPYIVVFSQIDQTIALPDFILPANQAQVAVYDIDDPYMQPTVAFSSDTRYDSITVCGEHVKAMGTFRLALTGLVTPGDYPANVVGNLVPAWDPELEALYAFASDEDRVSQKYEQVYTTYALPADFRWAQVCPACDDYGSVFVSGGVLSGETGPGTWANGYTVGKRFERYIPVPDYEASAIGSDYRPISAIYQDSATGKWYPVFGRAVPVEEGEDSPTAPVQIQPLDGRVGVKLKPAGLNHILAKGYFDADSETEPVMTPTDIYITAFLQTDARPFMRGYLPQNSGTGAGPLVIVVPGCEFWFAAGKPALYADNGAVEFYNGTGDAAILRDDRAKLASAYALAYAIYSRPRRPVTLSYSTLFPGAPIGYMIMAIVNNMRRREVGTCITECSWDFESGTTQIRTGYSEMDIARLAGGL
jgi:hypothetical protein